MIIRSQYAPASEASIAAAAALLDRHRRSVAPLIEPDHRWGRKVAASIGALALTACTGVFFAALVAGSMVGLIAVMLNIHR